MAEPRKAAPDGDPLMREASKGFVNAPSPEPTTETLQRALHPRDYDQWKATEDAKLKRANDIKDAAVNATVKADEEAARIAKENEQKALEASKQREAYRTRSAEAAKKE
jgi:hypothetical protein